MNLRNKASKEALRQRKLKKERRMLAQSKVLSKRVEKLEMLRKVYRQAL